MGGCNASSHSWLIRDWHECNASSRWRLQLLGGATRSEWLRDGYAHLLCVGVCARTAGGSSDSFALHVEKRFGSHSYTHVHKHMETLQ